MTIAPTPKPVIKNVVAVMPSAASSSVRVVVPSPANPPEAGPAPVPPNPSHLHINYNQPDVRGTKVYITVELKGHIKSVEYHHMMTDVTTQVAGVVARHNAWYKQQQHQMTK